MNPRRKTILAVLFLVVASLVALRGLFFRGGDDESSMDSELIEDDPTLLDDEGSSQDADTRVGADLVALHGSASAGLVVNDAFGVKSSRVQDVQSTWSEEEGGTGDLITVPRHHVSLTLVMDQKERAVVDERVVAVGDAIAGGEVIEISQAGIVVRDGPDRRTYGISEGPTLPVGYVEVKTEIDSDESEEKGP